MAAITELQGMGIRIEDILWVGTKGDMEEQLVARAGINLETIAAGPIVGVPWAERARNMVKLARGMRSAGQIVRRFRPNVMFMTGGYVSAPVAVAARRNQVPIVVYLPDVEPGSSIRSVLSAAHRIACTTEGSRDYVPEAKMVVTGYPVRPELRAALRMTKTEALTRFKLQTERPTLFVFGGSRGARNINRALIGILPSLLAEVQVIHISGTLTWDEVEEASLGLPPELRAYYRPYPYLHEDMGAAFRAADLVVARAGASMLGECPAFGLPSILIPLTFAWRYQKVNADYLTGRGAAIQLKDEGLAETLLPAIRELLFDPARLQAMAESAAALDRPRAAAQLAHIILEEADPPHRAVLPLEHEEASC